jgi:hypothetical protein
VFKTATNKIKTIFDKPFDAELPDESSNRVDSGDDDDNDHKYNDIEQDDDFNKNSSSSNNSRRSTSFKDNDKDNGNNKINNYSNITSSSSSTTKNTSSIKTNNSQNSNNKLKTIKIAPVAISKPPRPPTPPTEDLFKVDDEFGDFIPNTETNFANFDNFEAKASTTSIDDIISFDIQPNKQQPQQNQSIDDLFSTLTVDTSPIMPTPIATTIKQTSNIDDLFKNLNFSPQPPPQQQQYQMPMSQTMPNIFQQKQQQINPSTRQSTVIINIK